MPGKTALRLTKRSVEALVAEGRDSVFWDSDLPGFGVRVYRTGRRVYCVQTRGLAGPKRVTLGRHGEITADAARREAATVIDRIKRGEDPFPVAPEPEPTVAALAERFLRAHVEVNCSANTRDSFGLIVRKHIVPALGGLAVSAVERRHVVALHDSLSAMPTQANRTLAVLSAMFRLAEAWDLVAPGSNPCRGVRRYKETPRERFLSRDEYRRLGRVLSEAEKDGSENPVAVAAIRLLLLTGCRRNEILTLQWDDVDRVAGELRLKDAKAGARRVPLTPAIEAVLSGIPRAGDNPWVIAGRRPGQRIGAIHRAWMRLRVRAGLEDVRLHDLRHGYASRALALGAGLPMIGRLLGHATVSATARYAHLSRDSEKASAARVGGSIGKAILAPDAA